MKIQYFKSKDLVSLRNEYRELAKRFHPDLGGDTEIMKIINLEYEYLSKYLIYKQPDWSESKKSYQYRCNIEMMDIIQKIIHIPDIKIEIIGVWLWISGNTLSKKEYFKSLGMNFSGKKLAWYWHKGEYIKLSNKKFSLYELRELYGTKEIENQKVSALS